MKRLESEQVNLYYEEGTNSLIGIDFLDEKATTIDLNKVNGVDMLRAIDLFAAMNWPFEDEATPHIILPKNIAHIKEKAFQLSKVEEITWPDKCHMIPDNCFQNSSISKLHNIDHVAYVGQGAFVSCWNLKSFDWPATVSHADIPPQCFKNCINLAEINHIENVVDVGEEAFYKCGMRTFEWPMRAKIIGRECFEYSAIEEIHGIENVEEIGSSAFSQCDRLKKFTWPKNCRNISSCCFEGCSELSVIDGLENICEIGKSAFKESGLKKIDLSQSACFKIEEYAFAKSKIKEFIPGYYTVVGKRAFFETALESRKRSV